jgi:negative regulator of sigma E activity
MNDTQLLEWLSAMMDEALSAEQMLALFVELKSKPDLIKKWQRYHMIQTLLQENNLLRKDIQKQLKNMQNRAVSRKTESMT